MKIRREAHYYELPVEEGLQNRQEETAKRELHMKFAEKMMELDTYCTKLDITTFSSHANAQKEYLIYVEAILLTEDTMKRLTQFMQAHCSHFTPEQYEEFGKIFKEG